jgi:hypothetical protein
MDIGPKGMVSHSSSEKIKDGNGEREANAKDRLKKHGSIISCYGENLSFHCVDAKEVIMGLLVDDGSKTRGHRHNILNPDFNYMGCFTGDHSDFNQMSCINYCAGYVTKGEPDPIEQQMDAFLKEEVVFADMPDNCISWKQHSKIKVLGAKAIKTTVRTCTLKGGEEKKVEVVEEKLFDLRAIC